MGNRNVGSAIRPTASKRQVDAHPEFAAFFIRELERVDELVGKERHIAVEFERVDGLDFDSTHTARFHEPEFALDIGLRDGRSEPPPAHHDAAVVGRGLEGLVQVGGQKANSG